ncbi:carboxymuconolactone decarboxylase family protein [Novosphingobium sp. ERN07]|uniref:carboxymuconolactone decarboxylase family protein n=1 Tax=Novosphingobium sp. ERN07 TaxID=2726187 RepID=UPI0014569F3A|nr:carboxymuconolactone decarboxylase family protein [Novosphingobium sp. ERN07]NLR73421.1 carboxymuconolactone decarboxylase family protein [Novosphingobium sp. ERN07]
MTREQRAAYESSPSAKLNLSRLLAQAETLQPGMTRLIRAMMTDTSLPPLEREIIILAVLHLDRGAYEWAQHLQVAAAMDIDDATVAAIADDRFADPAFTDRERALLAFTRQTVRTVRVDPPVFDAVAAFYDDRQIVEAIHVIGIYMLIVRVSEVAELEIDAVHGAEVWKHAAANS